MEVIIYARGPGSKVLWRGALDCMPRKGELVAIGDACGAVHEVCYFVDESWAKVIILGDQFEDSRRRWIDAHVL